MGKNLIIFVLYSIMLVAFFVACTSDDGGTTPQPDHEISLLFPNGGDSLVMGDSCVVVWEDNFNDNISIEFYKGLDSTAVKVLGYNDLESNGQYSFILPTDLSVGDDYKLKILNVLDSTVSDKSDDYFSISSVVVGDVIGRWNVLGSWNKWEGIWEFFNDGTFSNSWGTSGTWLLINNDISWEYPSGTYYSGVVEGNSMSGMIDGGSGLTGVWSAQKILE